MGLGRISYIKEKWSVIDYAHDVLKLPINKNGDRCMSPTPGEHKTNNAFVAYDSWWYDFSAGCGGDVIDLCAVMKHNGNIGEAIRDLAGDYGIDPEWVNKTQERNDMIAYFHKALTETQLRYLRDRRIYKETIDRLRIGFNEQENRLIIPYYKNGYVAYYIGRDMSGRAGASKYKKAFLDGYTENIAWGLHSLEPKRREEVKKQLTPEKYALTDELIIIAEGAFDALSFEQEGFKVLSPISGYFSKEAKKQVLNICQAHKKVFVCFDNDKAGSRFTVDFCQQLFKYRVNFLCGTLPDGVKDVSEYYADHNGDLFELVRQAVSGIGMLAAYITDKTEFERFIYDAARFVKKSELIELCDHASQFSSDWLKAVREQAFKMPPEAVILEEFLAKYKVKFVENLGFYEYKHGVWTQRADNYISRYLSELLGQWKKGTTLSSLKMLLKAETTSTELFNRKPIFNFKNGTLEIETGKFREHSEFDMSSTQVPYEYNTQAECPQWNKFIYEIMDGRESSMRLLQEMAGYVLVPDCRFQKCFFLKGDGANGKSVFLKGLATVFGEENVSTVEMSNLTNAFQCISLATSLVNISTETKTNVAGAETIFKSIVTGDMISACYKNKDFITFKPRCVMISACNEFVASRDITEGFNRRLCFIDFPCKFEGKNADTKLLEKLITELPGIFNWVYEGYKRLIEQGYFTSTLEQEELLKDYMELSNPIISFCEETFSNGIKYELSRKELYKLYKSWAAEAGHEPQSQTKFTKNFKKTATQIFSNYAERKTQGEWQYEFSNPYPTEEELFGKE